MVYEEKEGSVDLDRSIFERLVIEILFFINKHRKRPMIRFIKDLNKKDLVGVEIGVFKGVHSKNILSSLKLKKLYLVDPFLREKNKEDGARVVNNRLRKFVNKYYIISKKSDDAVDEIPSNLDFVYIDGNHDYKYVKSDIENYYPKVKKGGVIGGHDFSIHHYGVCKAVIEFAEKNDLKLHGGELDWWIKKG